MTGDLGLATAETPPAEAIEITASSDVSDVRKAVEERLKALYLSRRRPTTPRANRSS